MDKLVFFAILLFITLTIISVMFFAIKIYFFSKPIDIISTGKKIIDTIDYIKLNKKNKYIFLDKYKRIIHSHWFECTQYNVTRECKHSPPTPQWYDKQV